MGFSHSLSRSLFLKGPRGTAGWARGPRRGRRGRGQGERERRRWQRRRRRAGGQGGGAGLFLNSASTRSLALWFLRVVYSIFLFLRRPSPTRVRAAARGLVGSGSAWGSPAGRRVPGASASRRRLDGRASAAVPGAAPRPEFSRDRRPFFRIFSSLYSQVSFFFFFKWKRRLGQTVPVIWRGPWAWGRGPSPGSGWRLVSDCHTSSLALPSKVGRATGLMMTLASGPFVRNLSQEVDLDKPPAQRGTCFLCVYVTKGPR